MSSDDLITVIHHDGDAYRQLLSGSVLLQFARGRWAMDAPDLPDTYREIHWYAVVCVTALAWLLEQGPQVDTGTLHWVLDDLIHANQNGRAAFAPLARHIQLHGRDSGVKVVEVFFPSMTEAAFRLSCQSITNVLQIIGDSPTIARAVEQWLVIYAILAPELAADRPALSMIVEGVGRELATVNNAPPPETDKGQQASEGLRRCPVELRGKGNPILVHGEEYPALRCRAFDVVKVLVDAWASGAFLTREQIRQRMATSEDDNPDVAKTIKDDLQPLLWWTSVVEMKGTARKSDPLCYRIRRS